MKISSTADSVILSFFAVPSKIIDHLSSDDMDLREGDTVLLVCNVTGVPHPNVTWYRLSKKGKNGRESKSFRCVLIHFPTITISSLLILFSLYICVVGEWYMCACR